MFDIRSNDNFIKNKTLPCSSGSRIRKKHMLITKGNNLSLKEIGQIDTYEQIQSYRDGVDLHKMIDRFSRGDSSALIHGQGFYGDVSGFATNPAEVISNTRVISEFGKEQASAAQDPAEIKNENPENVSENGKEGDMNA